MFLNELPDDCLRIIFDLLCDMDDLKNCLEVCKRWRGLIYDRSRKVKHILHHLIGQSDCSPEIAYYRTEEPVDEMLLSNLFKNLMFVDCDKPLSQKVKNIDELVRNSKSLKGFIRTPGFYDAPQPLENYECIFGDIGLPCNKKILTHAKQLYLDDETLDSFRTYAKFCQNLERLHLANMREGGKSDHYYHGQVLEKLKILELGLSACYEFDLYFGFQFMDTCPNLRSAHIKLDHDTLFVSESLKHKCLQDLVIDFVLSSGVAWKELERLMMKYPNLKHLALRNNKLLNDKHIETLVGLLPNLEIFDVRTCPNVTQKAACYVHYYYGQKRTDGRPIEFYFNANDTSIGSHWPELSTQQDKANLGFDFMKNCFFKYFDNLPHFLIPID